jgi:hypothetical protein
MIWQPVEGQDFPHCLAFTITLKDTPYSEELLQTSDHPDADTSTWQHTHTYKRHTSMPPAEFEPVILASERLQAHALDCEATAIGPSVLYYTKNSHMFRHLKNHFQWVIKTTEGSVHKIHANAAQDYTVMWMQRCRIRLAPFPPSPC